ncbi:MAG: glycosyltransferase, partial [Prolixibacteraceae bacterium]|nr:glycosyltransferase [Prolixibacteraceae bacterium]
VSKLRNKKLVFDSHEYFTEVPELINRPRTQKIWKGIEKRIVPKIKHAYTVCDSIAELFEKEYGVKFGVVRNVPEKQEVFEIPKEKKIDTDKKIILYQGAINIGRGIPEIISAMKHVENALLLIVGSGDILEEVKDQVKQEKLEDKVVFTGRIPANEVKYFTAQADLGLSIEKDMGLNYRFALPNKLFDYIGATVPVMVSNLPEMAKLVGHYKIGSIIDSHEPEYLAKNLTKALENEELRKVWKANLKRASEELTWQNEEKVLMRIFEF